MLSRQVGDWSSGWPQTAVETPHIALRVCYAQSGTELGYGATRQACCYSGPRWHWKAWVAAPS
eukprot:498646-Rhodomonas_salina.2